METVPNNQLTSRESLRLESPQLEMIHVSRTPEFSNGGTMNLDGSPLDTTVEMDPNSAAFHRRPRSHSYHSPDDNKNYDSQADAQENITRPRSRSFYSFDEPEISEGNFTRSNAMRPRASSLLHFEAGKKEKSPDGALSRLLSKQAKKTKAIKHSTCRDLDGSRGSLKGIHMMTISESDNWEISCCSGMKYGQFVDWEKIDPEAADRYQKILSCEHQELKTMGRAGFWAMPHTLRAKAYYHIIHSINSRSITSQRDVYQDVSKKIFGEQKMTTHPFPEYMEDGGIPRYCLNKAGLNSVKKILLCIGKYFPDINFCPILPALVSLLLHFSEDEAECFHSICRLIAYKDPNKRYIDQTFLTYRASCMTFGDLANKYCRGIRKLIASSHQNLFEFYSDWIMWIFADLPFTYAIRVLDVYLLEGYKVLYRVALALLSLYKVSVSSRVADVEDFRRDMKSFVESVARHCSIEKLLERAFNIQMATRKELNLLFNANKDSLMQKGVSIHQKRQAVQTVDFGNFKSGVVTGTEMRIVWAWIPERFALFEPMKLFSTDEHVRSLSSVYTHVEGHEPAVLLLKTMDEEVCGAFLSTDLSERKRLDSDRLQYFGTGESFVFTLRPGMERYQCALVRIMSRRCSSQDTCSTGPPHNPCLTCPFNTPPERPVSISPKTAKEQGASRFIAANNKKLIIGGDGGHAIYLQEDLQEGYTERCDTFESAPLCKGHFKIQSLEVWGVQNSISFSHYFTH